MAWEEIEKERGALTSEGWKLFPAVRINKTVVTLNELFMKTFVGTSRRVKVYIDKEVPRLGIKVCDSGEDGYSIQQVHFKAKHVGTLTSSKLLAMLPDGCVGKDFAAVLNPGQRIIEVSLLPDNVLE